MVELYATLIISTSRTFDSIPDKFKNDVELELKKRGYDTNGDKLSEVK